MIYITGDTHRDFSRLYGLEVSSDDMLIILGDSGINYYLNEEVDMFGSKVFVEEDFPNLIFAKDGEVYNVNCKSILVIGWCLFR